MQCVPYAEQSAVMLGELRMVLQRRVQTKEFVASTAEVDYRVRLPPLLPGIIDPRELKADNSEYMIHL